MQGIQPPQQPNKKGSNAKWIIAGVSIVLVLILSVIVFITGYKKLTGRLKGQETVTEEAAVTAEPAGSEELVIEENEPVADTEEGQFAQMLQKLNNSSEGLEKIDVYAENYSPAERDTNYKWSTKLFYSLEEISPDSTEDGLINGYSIEKKQLINASTNNLMEYEIYRNPDTNVVNKIVSIEYKEDMLEITDYYYTDKGKINFIFVRNDKNYVPSYATPDKSGQRFYFSKDTLVKWRTVDEGKQKNYLVGKAEKDRGGNAGTVKLYKDLSKDTKKKYNSKEKKMINAAYNTYNIVLSAKGIGNIVGYVYDNYGQPLSSATINLYTEDYTNVVYQCVTNSEGKYAIIVPTDARSYRIEVAKEGYVNTILYNINMNEQMIGVYQETIYLVNSGLDYECNTELIISDAFNVSTDYNGMLRLVDAQIKVRKGINNKTGEVYATGYTNSNGVVYVTLEPGMYTVEVNKAGYADTYYTIAVVEDNAQIAINTTPVLNEGEVRIVLTWDSVPQDLDSHLFTPYDSSSGDSTYHIWYGNKSDNNQNNLDVDDTNGYGPETMTINNLGNGLYKYYVADYSDCANGNTKSTNMSFSNATVDVYTADGLAHTFHVPSSRAGVIWEVFEIRNKTIVPIQRYYDNIDNKTWWNNDK